MHTLRHGAAAVLGLALATGNLTRAQAPENLVVEGIPPAPPALRDRASRYLEFRAATFQDWHPTRREVLLATRFAEATQLHRVAHPGGARQQLTFLSEPVAGGGYRPGTGEFLVFSQDTGGGEFYQLYRYGLEDGRAVLLTDGKSRNTAARWSHDGRWLAYSSTRRTGRDTDLYLVDPADPKTDRLLLALEGGGWTVTDWSRDGAHLLVLEYLSINESRLHRVDVRAGSREQISPAAAEPVAYGPGQFAPDGRSVYVTSDLGSEFRQLVRLELATRTQKPLTADLRWDVEAFDLSVDGQTLALVTNEDGSSVLRLLEVATGRELAAPKLPLGVISGLKWHPSRAELAFTLSSARAPSDVYSVEPATGAVTRWTASETGGLDPERFVEPERVRLPSFDGLEISALVYRPDAARFPGRRPVVVSIHGGPESQARPVFQGRNNYYLNELGVAVVYPNVRGSSGYGKRFLTLDNGYLREDAVRDLGALLDWIQRDAGLEATRVAVLGGSYGGYMVLACLVHYGERLRAGVDVVGISNFVTFLTRTQDYRRDLRRVEYGDERDPAMRAFLERISPATQARRIRQPLFVVQGLNDPRVPATESEQMVRAIREQGGTVWYLLARDEGHGFAKKRNQDYQFLATIQFLEQHLSPAPELGPEAPSR
ncbi:MAG: S9 family peptidase [Verrucomicrobia bacterium]|nr:S9 family peptidase [Verrucomicrobiota bacterium]